MEKTLQAIIRKVRVLFSCAVFDSRPMGFVVSTLSAQRSPSGQDRLSHHSLQTVTSFIRSGISESLSVQTGRVLWQSVSVNEELIQAYKFSTDDRERRMLRKCFPVVRAMAAAEEGVDFSDTSSEEASDVEDQEYDYYVEAADHRLDQV